MEVQIVPSGTVVTLPERLDTSVAREVEQELIRIADGSTGDLFCDFTRTRYISSAGLRAIFVAQKRLKARNSRLSAFGLSPYVREVFEISGFNRIIPLFETEAEAFCGGKKL